MANLTKIQEEILKAFVQLNEKAMFTEAILAKKVRENLKLDGKKKAGIAIADLEKVMEYVQENNLGSYSLHLNSANDLLIKKDDNFKLLDIDAKHRRLSSEKSMSILTNGDLVQNKGKNKKIEKRSERKRINLNSDFED